MSCVNTWVNFSSYFYSFIFEAKFIGCEKKSTRHVCCMPRASILIIFFSKFFFNVLNFYFLIVSVSFIFIKQPLRNIIPKYLSSISKYLPSPLNFTIRSPIIIVKTSNLSLCLHSHTPSFDCCNFHRGFLKL